ncbi:MAG TPA: long-chain-fatty-acid--CoA ligase [Nevskiaceae bacterium]|nr:long-chain-fatty-acid--CoA ligase [Nevskiaceae bacterium]
MPFTQSLHRAVQQRPEALATACGTRRQTFRQLHDRVARLAGGLRKLGIRDGNRVAMLALNSDHYLTYYLAVPWAGAVVTPLNVRWSLAEVIQALRDAESVAIFLDDRFAAEVESLMEACPFLRFALYCGEGVCPDGLIDLETLIGASTAIGDAGLAGDEIFGVFYTGGTTGRPKGAQLTHAALATSALSLMSEGLFATGSVGLHAAPMFHLADLMMTTGLLLRGGTQVMVPVFRADAVGEPVQAFGVTDLLLVPAMLQALVDAPATAGFDFRSVRRLAYGASPIAEALLERAMKALPGVDFYQVYGLTEIAAVGTVLRPEWHRPEQRASGRLRSAGRAACHVQIRIHDDQDRPLPTGQIGEIQIRSPALMIGYLNQPEATAAALQGGWMRTGDAGYLDEEGFVFVVDRLKDLIISGGENIYCSEVENALAGHPAVAACAVIGIPDPDMGEKVHAAVVLKPGASLTLDALTAHCKGLIAGYKCPRSLELRESLPISAAGKVLKTELRKPFWEGHHRAVH